MVVGGGSEGAGWSWGVDRREAMAIWHQACSLLLFSIASQISQVVLLVQAVVTSLFDLIIIIVSYCFFLILLDIIEYISRGMLFTE